MLWGGKLLVETIIRQTRTPSSVHSQRNGINCLNSCWIMLCKPSGWSIGLQTGRPGFDARCHQTPSEYTRSTCSLNQWVRSLVGLITSAGTGEYFPPLQSRCRNCGDRGRVAIYRPFGELRRAKIVLSPVWCSRPTTDVPLAHATMDFVGLDLTASDRWHQTTTTTTTSVKYTSIMNYICSMH
ncbi:hypothetical protein TNCV_919521 [Trichonephila clavipes]|nr:hypothetical protein TNCV_919521 [Trichonephila clavipes]